MSDRDHEPMTDHDMFPADPSPGRAPDLEGIRERVEFQEKFMGNTQWTADIKSLLAALAAVSRDRDEYERASLVAIRDDLLAHRGMKLTPVGVESLIFDIDLALNGPGAPTEEASRE